MIKPVKQRHFRLNATQMVVLGFLSIILLGAVLLMLPISSRGHHWTGFMTALFTATSSTCVTGLIVVDTYQYWSIFGQTVILLMIQIGGLGFMSVASLFSFLFRRQISLKERLVMRQSLNMNNISGIVRLTKHMIMGSLLTEAVGALILSVRFASDFGLAGGIAKGIFHSVSAYCNAGFDLMGEQGAFSSLTGYAGDIVVNAVICLLIVIGGLGFFVWEDIFQARSFKKLQPYSKVVLLTTLGLLVTGAVLFACFEIPNPQTMGSLDGRGKVLAPIFQSVTCRTAGYNTIDQGAMTPSSKVLSILLMFIGGSSGSTAGGIKTMTFALLVMTVFLTARGKRHVVIFHRKVGSDNLLRALSIVGIAGTAIIVFTMVISSVEGLSMMDALFECVSAFGTVGLTTGITGMLSEFSLSLLAVLMFFGRVGVLTITMATVIKLNGASDTVNYPETKVLIG